ncbi:MAG: hypothetical protein G01um101466_24 [Parcubacteria group bacterium Gr01-1014_66]|nr:MAG: hypothetical protein G01um101466_24 [Parcubacteria group bacterium Gr01-1014_66]
MAEGTKGRLYVRMWRPSRDVKNLPLFQDRVARLLIAAAGGQEHFFSSLRIRDMHQLDYFIVMSPTEASASEPDLHKKIMQIASNCSFEEITDNERVEVIIRDAINRGMHSTIPIQN